MAQTWSNPEPSDNEVMKNELKQQLANINAYADKVVLLDGKAKALQAVVDDLDNKINEANASRIADLAAKEKELDQQKGDAEALTATARALNEETIAKALDLHNDREAFDNAVVDENARFASAQDELKKAQDDLSYELKSVHDREEACKAKEAEITATLANVRVKESDITVRSNKILATLTDYENKLAEIKEREGRAQAQYDEATKNKADADMTMAKAQAMLLEANEKLNAAQWLSDGLSGQQEAFTAKQKAINEDNAIKIAQLNALIRTDEKNKQIIQAQLDDLKNLKNVIINQVGG